MDDSTVVVVTVVEVVVSVAGTAGSASSAAPHDVSTSRQPIRNANRRVMCLLSLEETTRVAAGLISSGEHHAHRHEGDLATSSRITVAGQRRNLTGLRSVPTPGEAGAVCAHPSARSAVPAIRRPGRDQTPVSSSS